MISQHSDSPCFATLEEEIPKMLGVAPELPSSAQVTADELREQLQATIGADLVDISNNDALVWLLGTPDLPTSAEAQAEALSKFAAVKEALLALMTSQIE